MLADTDRKAGWADTFGGLMTQEALYDSVFQRVEADQNQASAALHDAQGLGQRSL